MNEDQLPEGPADLWPDDESQGRFPVYINIQKKRDYGVKWLVLWQDPSEIGVSIMEQAELERPLTQTEYRVRDWLLGYLGMGNYVFVNQAEMAKRLRIQRADASRAIKSLINRGIILQGPKAGRSNTYAVNPAFCFIGNLGIGTKERKQAIKDGKKRQEARMLEFKTGKPIVETTNENQDKS